MKPKSKAVKKIKLNLDAAKPWHKKDLEKEFDKAAVWGRKMTKEEYYKKWPK